MISRKLSRAWSSPERYVQGKDELKNIKKYTNKFGEKIVFLIDSFLFKEINQQLGEIYSRELENIKTYKFENEVTEEVINEYVDLMKLFSPNVIVGIGGGKTIDVAKAASALLGLRFIIIPTIASTDAPTSSLSVLYDKNGNHLGEFFYDHSPSLVLVDSRIIANAPTRFLVSGMGDSLATLIEAEAAYKSNTRNLVYYKDGGFLQTVAGKNIAKVCEETLFENGELAKISCDKNIVTPYLENIIETNILLSGIGFENNATAGAHSINDGITTLPEQSKTMHGEKVAFGCFVQLMAESESVERIRKIMQFCMKVGLPVCLEDLYIANTKENILQIARGSMNSNWKNMPFEVDVESVYSSIVLADEFGRQEKENFNKNNKL
ncbi:MAG TPA: glycerol dehydrogenase [Clostridiaceae bacterium]|nr:glycerol dehydrogenase [Clostridiaceae bacterium]